MAKAQAELQKSIELDPSFIDGYVASRPCSPRPASGPRRSRPSRRARPRTRRAAGCSTRSACSPRAPGDDRVAKEAFLKAEQLDPQNFETQYHLATVALNQNDKAEAIARLEKFIAAAPAGTPMVETREVADRGAPEEVAGGPRGRRGGAVSARAPLRLAVAGLLAFAGPALAGGAGPGSIRTRGRPGGPRLPLGHSGGRARRGRPRQEGPDRAGPARRRASRCSRRGSPKTIVVVPVRRAARTAARRPRPRPRRRPPAPARARVDAVRNPTLVTLLFDSLDAEGRLFARKAALDLAPTRRTGPTSSSPCSSSATGCGCSSSSPRDRAAVAAAVERACSMLDPRGRRARGRGDGSRRPTPRTRPNDKAQAADAAAAGGGGAAAGAAAGPGGGRRGLRERRAARGRDGRERRAQPARQQLALRPLRAGPAAAAARRAQGDRLLLGGPRGPEPAPAALPLGRERGQPREPQRLLGRRARPAHDVRLRPHADRPREVARQRAAAGLSRAAGARSRARTCSPARWPRTRSR